MNYGYKNELDFVNLFNGKCFCELDDNSKNFLNELFDIKIEDNEKIVCWKNKETQKADIFIKCRNYVKGVSLKCGNSNSVHSEKIQDFKRFLLDLNIPFRIVEKYVSYHYGYFKNEMGNSDYSRRLSSEEYKNFYQDEIDCFNEYINKTKVIIDMVDRFLIRGKDFRYDIDALVSGTVDDYVWILKHNLYDLILFKRFWTNTSPHVSCMTIGPKKRGLDGDTTRIRDRYVVVVRWNNIREDIIRFHQMINGSSFQ